MAPGLEPPWHSLAEPVLRRGHETPERVAFLLLHEGEGIEEVRCGDFSDRIRRRAAALRGEGIEPGSVLLLALDHSRALPECFYAALLIGAIPAILPSGLSQRAVASEDAKQHLLSFVRATHAAAIVVPSAVHTAIAATLPSDLAVDESCLLASDALLPDQWHRPAPQEYAFLQFSSGSGGRQKAIPHRYIALFRYLRTRVEKRPELERDVVASWLPLSHDLGLLFGLLTPQLVGSLAVLMSPHYWVRQPAVWLRAIHRYRATLASVPNFALNHCTRAVRDTDLEGVRLDSLEALMCGGEPVRAESIEAFEWRFAQYGLRPHVIRPGYGMAEAVEAATVTPSEGPHRVDWIDREALLGRQRAEPIAKDHARACAVVSCGLPFPGIRVQIVDDRGDTKEERDVGEIRLQGPWLFDGYYGEPGSAAGETHERWLSTGDLGYLADGELFVTGRKKDLIIVGGRNIAPEDIELLADSVPGTAPGRSVAFGIFDPRLGSERATLLCEEASADLRDNERLAIERELRARVQATFDIVLADVRVVARGWTIKTPSGKTARPANRDKYLATLVAVPRPIGPG